MKEELRIRSVDQFIHSLKNTSEVSDGRYCFRGQANHAWPTLPSLLRRPRYEAMLLQRALFARFLMKSRDIPYLKSNDPIELLMILQHFEIPTKLLDCTFDPLVALFFACYDPKKENTTEDGKFLIYPLFQYDKLLLNDPSLDIYNEAITAENIKERFFPRFSPDKHLFFEPLFKNARMRAQNGCFFLFSANPLEENDLEFVSLETFHKHRNEHLRELNKTTESKNLLLWFAHVLIDKKSKNTILEELNYKYGINHQSLFLETEYLHSAKGFFKNYYSEGLKKFEELKQQIPIERASELRY